MKKILVLFLFPVFPCLFFNSKKTYATDSEKPIIVKDYIFYLEANKITARDLNDLSTSYKMDGDYSIKPVSHLSSNKWGDVVFFSKNCILKIFEYKGKDTLKGKLLYSNRFSKLEGEHCYLTLNVYFNEAIDYIAAYNTQFHKINVYQLKGLNKENVEEENVIEFETKNNVCQALIYNKGAFDIILIGITRQKMYFWILKGNYSWKDYFVSNREIFDIESYFDCMGKDTAGLIGNNKLLYIRDSIYLFDLSKLEIITHLDIEHPSTLTVFNRWKALVGNELGYIYLIICREQNIKIARTYQVCDGEILNISFDNGYYYNYESYRVNFKFAIQCKGKKEIYFTIFELDKEGIEDL